MIKIEFWPSGLNKALFELKLDGNSWTLLFTKEAFSEMQDRGQIWSVSGIEEKIAQGILDQVNTAIAEKYVPEMRVISGGISVTITGRIKGKEVFHRFMGGEAGPAEKVLVEKVIELVYRNIADKNCRTYLGALSRNFKD